MSERQFGGQEVQPTFTDMSYASLYVYDSYGPSLPSGPFGRYAKAGWSAYRSAEVLYTGEICRETVSTSQNMDNSARGNDSQVLLVSHTAGSYCVLIVLLKILLLRFICVYSL